MDPALFSFKFQAQQQGAHEGRVSDSYAQLPRLCPTIAVMGTTEEGGDERKLVKQQQ